MSKRLTQEEIDYLRQLKTWSKETRTASAPSLAILQKLFAKIGNTQDPHLVLNHIDWLIAFIETHIRQLD